MILLSKLGSMANPSLKNGYISVANELVEKLATLSIPSSEMRIVWVVWRKTWGWSNGDRKKDWDWISLSQFVKFTGIKHGNIPKLLKSLVYKRILLKKENGYKFNQNYDEWVVCKRITPVCKRITGGNTNVLERVIQTHTNKRNKETITKDISASAEDWSFEAEMKKLKESERKDYKIIAWYWGLKGITFANKEQYTPAFKRNLAPARDLKGYHKQQIASVVSHCNKDFPMWTLETVAKRISEQLANKTI